ncbi:uncharacterized protein LOC128848059 isoform X2 [Malaclemys terrapin pileata]|uniref:uncharacterized protein LOC128848059 isoform X2 n=1 Tax=Malaclemys terrapin pileata TaxID=2991368 RepID=UPI0023A820D9|nr:uncharacterized protein LOC128848059 isoform X2 [Malaclemys terrapin pileata]
MSARLALVDWLDEGFSSIIELAAVSEPRRDPARYRPGQEVAARCPLFKGLNRARILALSGDRQELKWIQVQAGGCPGSSWGGGMPRGPPYHRVATWRRDRVPPERRKHSTGGNADDVTTSVLDPEGTQVSEDEGRATPQSTSSSETWHSSSPDCPHVDSSGCGVPCSPGPADPGVRAGPTEPCARPECERMRQELEALRDRYAKLEAQNAVLSQRLGGDVELPREVDSSSVRPEPGLYQDPALPQKHGEQARSNLSGENGLRRLSPPVVSAIVAYAVGQSQFQPSSAAVIKNSLRNKLGCLRAPSRQQGATRGRPAA